MSKKIRILYLQPFESWGKAHFCTEPFIRISNYLNSKKHKINGEIEEEYVDLRIEGLPHYWPEEIGEYRDALRNLLKKIYKRFKFDIAAISCYTSFCYLNSIEIAKMIKHLIDSSCYIVFGGYHASVCPEDLFIENIPHYFDEFYPQNTTPVDYIILDEGEIPFYHLVQRISNGTNQMRNGVYENPVILQREILENLNEVPIIDLSLFEKYKERIREIGDFYIQWRRGCQFRCKFCPPSENYMPSYRRVRYKSLENCIKELNIILDTKWLNFENLFIVDPIFFSRNVKDQFFKELEKIYHKISFKTYIFERVETCSISDLKKFKKFNIIPGIGLETTSKKLLSRIGKNLGRTSADINKGALTFLEKVLKIIEYANEIDTPVIFFYMLGLPGADINTFKESRSFFFDKNYDGQGIMERYKVNLHIGIYGLLIGSTIYDKGEAMFGAKYYYKQWWKIFNKEQYLYCAVIRPSKHLSFSKSIQEIFSIVDSIFKAQKEFKNPFYSITKHIWYRRTFSKLLNLYDKTLNKSVKAKTPYKTIPLKIT